MSVKRKLHFFRRVFRHKWCYFLLFSVSFICFVLAISFLQYHAEGGRTWEHDRHDSESDNFHPMGRKKKTMQKVETDEDNEWMNKDAKTVFRAAMPGSYEKEPPPLPSATGPGEGGKAVNTDGASGDVRRAMNEYGFNTAASDKISLNRTIPDTRPAECQYWEYPTSLPTASVIIVFHNEGWTPLLRTVQSVLLRSPPRLLKEVLMVDDASTKPHLKGKLDEYLKKYQGKVRLLRNAEREGLIRSRSIGAENARGDVVVFLDAHCETNQNWLPPLLAPIAADRRLMTVPVIDGIDMNTWAYHPQYGYRAGALFRGIFEWGLLYKEKDLPPQEISKRKYTTEPFRSPTHAGGLYAIDRLWFQQLGYYDPGLQIWGGEQYELSFKIWMCGGGILFVPCSRVGHVYRMRMPYGFGKLSGPIVATNHLRVASVWMDEYKKYYLIREPFMGHRTPGDISKQLELREKNKCKSFKWYMENVAFDVETEYPVQPENKVWGEAKNTGSSLCIDSMGQPIPGTLGVSSCHGYGGNQAFRMNVKGQFTSGEWCVNAVGKRLQTNRCQKGSVSGPWDFDLQSGHIINKDSDRCVTVDATQEILVLAQCQDSNLYQKFVWREIYQ